MKKWHVDIPIKGTISYEVEAEDEESAKESAWDKYNNSTEWTDIEWETWESKQLGFTVDAEEES